MDYALAINIATDFIASVEGFSPNAYWDVNGYAIGYGNHYYEDGSDVQADDTIDKTRANTLLKKVVQGKEQAIRSYVTAPINENQYAALISLAYNCGEGNVRQSQLLQLINARASVDAIKNQFLQTCVTAKGQYMASLYDRRLDEFTKLYSNISQLIQQYPATSTAVAVGGLLVFGLIIFYSIRIAKDK